MDILIAELELSDELTGKRRDRCPDVVFRDAHQRIAAIRTDETQPELPVPTGSFNELVICDDALSRVIDEEAWLAEINRVVANGGKVCLTLPAENPLAWLDTMNVYRYIADLSGRGHAPNAARPTGWNRHYRKDEIERLMTSAGFKVQTIARQNHLWHETGILVGLLWRNWIHQDRDAERNLFARFGKRDPRKSPSAIGATWQILAHKP